MISKKDIHKFLLIHMKMKEHNENIAIILRDVKISLFLYMKKDKKT